MHDAGWSRLKPGQIAVAYGQNVDGKAAIRLNPAREDLLPASESSWRGQLKEAYQDILMSLPVFGSYTQEQLDAQYNQRTLVPDIKSYFKKWQAGSRRAKDRLVVQEAIAYGSDSEETIDVFPSASPGGALHVHYHGGAWRTLSSQDAWFLAEPWVESGCTFVSVNFGRVPQIPLGTQVNQARRALAWCHEKASDLKVDPGRIIVSGHSSGSHLAAMSALVDWGDMGKKQPEVQIVIIASGIYDLEPVRLSARNKYLSLSELDTLSLSPIRLL